MSADRINQLADEALRRMCAVRDAAWESARGSKDADVGEAMAACRQAIEALAAQPAQAVQASPALLSAPDDEWLMMPRHLTEAWATYAQGAFMDHAWSATECFAARYAELIAVTELARQNFAIRSTQAVQADAEDARQRIKAQTGAFLHKIRVALTVQDTDAIVDFVLDAARFQPAQPGENNG